MKTTLSVRKSSMKLRYQGSRDISSHKNSRILIEKINKLIIMIIFRSLWYLVVRRTRISVICWWLVPLGAGPAVATLISCWSYEWLLSPGPAGETVTSQVSEVRHHSCDVSTRTLLRDVELRSDTRHYPLNPSQDRNIQNNGCSPTKEESNTD